MSPGRRSWWRLLAIASVVAGVAFAAFGARVADANPAAEKLFEDGRAALAAGKVAEACDAFQRSVELERRVGTFLNLGDCQEKLGKLATAWEAFANARALATTNNDPRGAEADRRAGILSKRLPFLVISVPAAHRVDGLVIKRGGALVTAAEWDRPTPLDPGSFQIEASAPGFKPWTGTITLVEAKTESVEVPALERAAPPASDGRQPSDDKHEGVVGDATNTRVANGTSGGDISRAAGTPPSPARPWWDHHQLAIGALVGVSSDGDLIYGGRAVVFIDALGPGILRAVPQLLYARLDGAQAYEVVSLYAPSFSIEYQLPINHRFSIAGGLGAGVDLTRSSFDNPTKPAFWGVGRLSPTWRVWRLDIGLHFQVVRTGKATVELGELGVDYFFF